MSVVFAFFRHFYYTNNPPSRATAGFRDVGISCKPLAAHTPGALPELDFLGSKAYHLKNPCLNLQFHSKRHLTSSNIIAWDIKKLLTSVQTHDFSSINDVVVLVSWLKPPCRHAAAPLAHPGSRKWPPRAGRSYLELWQNPWRIHGAGILMLTWLGIYWWDPCYHIWQHHGSWEIWCPVLMCIAWSIPWVFWSVLKLTPIVHEALWNKYL